MRQRVQMQIQRMLDKQDDAERASVRSTLAWWGRWWRRRESGRLGYSPVSPSYRLIELARVGCEIQRTRKSGRSDEIHVPGDVARIDAAVDALPQAEREAVGRYYVRGERRRTQALLRAEAQVGRLL